MNQESRLHRAQAARRFQASLFCLVMASLGTLGSSGCARRRPELTTYAAPVPEDGAVFVADGAGNYQAFSQALRAAARQDGSRIQIVTFEWSHGYMRSVADQVHESWAREKGRLLAQEVLAYRRDHPDRPVHLAGHSAGAYVVLAALENLPPETVDRAILISPSVSAIYDLHPALHAIKGGLHNFYSRRDFVYCGLITRILGNSDRNHLVCSGRIGFHVLPRPGDEFLFTRLCQRAWIPADRAMGNGGGHFGNYEAEFLQTTVLPLFRMR